MELNVIKRLKNQCLMCDHYRIFILAGIEDSKKISDEFEPLVKVCKFDLKVKIYQFILKVFSRNKILTIIKGHNSFKNLPKMTHDNYKLNLVLSILEHTGIHLIWSHGWKIGYIQWSSYEPCLEKTCFWGFQRGLTQTRLYSHRRWLEAWNFGFKK